MLVAQLDPNTANTAQTIPAGNPAFQFYTNIPPVIFTRSQDGVRRYIQLWPDGRRPGWEITNTWQRGQVGIKSTNYLWQGLPPLTNFISGPAWDADGNPLHAWAGMMPVDGWIKRDWSDLYEPGTNGVGHDKSAKVTTKVDLYTRGFPNSTNRSLNTVLVDVYTIPGDPDSQVPGVYIPGEDITVLGEHPVERLVWKLLPDNFVTDATPVVSTNYTNYAFSLVPAKITLRIYRDNIDITDGNELIWVGEEAKMDCRLDTPGYNLSNFQWTIPPLAISNYYADSQTGRVDAEFSKTNNEVKYYWVDGAQNAVVVAQAVVNGFTLTAKTTFQVRRPAASIIAEIHTQVAVDDNWDSTPALHFGWHTTTYGITFGYVTDTANPPSYQWVQTGNALRRFKHATNNLWYRAGTNGLDTHYPYPKHKVNGVQYEWTGDDPGTTLHQLEHTANDGFTMHLMFKPPVVIRPTIWVPLRKIGWSWFGHAAYSNNSYVLVDGAPDKDQMDADSTAHPRWESNIGPSIDDIDDYQPE